MSRCAVYVHIPFCARKCAYCDFPSYPGQEARWRAYFETLEAEIAAWAEPMRDRGVPSVFFGGGTPSLVPPEFLIRTLDAVRRHFAVEPDAEITLEANPGTVDAAGLRSLRRAGFNRVSFGVQSFDDSLLRFLGRVHTAEQARQAVALARAAGFDNLNLDLMYALPGQSAEQWRDTLRQAVALSPEHVSAYSLILEEGTPMAAMARAGKIDAPGEDACVEMQRMATRALAQAGLARYEISNYARPGRQCRHNLTYWRRGDYLGLGCAAHSLLDGKRFHNPASLEEYLAGERMRDLEELTREDRVLEQLMLSTRTCEGLSLADFRREAGMEFLEYAPRAAEFTARGLAELRGGRFFLTERGMETQDAIVLELLH